MGKHHFIAFCFVLSVLVPTVSGSTIDINGKTYPVDTLEQYMAGPGIEYTRFNITMGQTVHRLYLLDIDLNNPYNSVEEHQSGNQMGKTETLANAYKSQDREGHRSVGGVNCNFWVVSGNISQSAEATRVWSGLLGQPFSGTAHGSVLIGNPSEDWNRGRADSDPDKEVGFVMIDENKRVFIDDMRYVAYVEHNGSRHTLRDCNRTRVNPDENELAVFNHYTYGYSPSRQVKDGVEVVVKLNENWAINKDIPCMVTDVNTTGGTQIQEGYAILQGRGSGKSFLEGVKKDDQLTLHLGVVNRKDSTLRPLIQEMVTGNCLVMENGVLTNRNTNESYNNRNYPRTMLATNNEGNRFYMLVSESPGNYTAEMCGILRNCGATYAVGMDGGGSAQMCMHEKVLNVTTEGNPRAVANSIWVFSTAPEDSTASSISSKTKSIVLPKYGVAQPVFNIYNKYGALLHHDFGDVRLTCEKETGYITEDNKFVCLGNGTLTATYQNVKLDIPVVCQQGSEPTIEFDSIWIDNAHSYTVQVFTRVEGAKIPILNSAMKWETEKPEVCQISEQGVITGVKNGGSWVFGTIDNLTDSIYVTTENPESSIMQLTDFTQAEEAWKPTTSSAVSTLTFTCTDEGGKLGFTYKKSRSPVITFSPNKVLYGLPKYIDLTIENKSFPLNSINISPVGHDKTSTTYSTGSLSDGEQTIRIDVEKTLGSDIAIFPIRLNTIKLMFDASAAEGYYELIFKKLSLVYEDTYSGTTQTTAQSAGRARKTLIDGNIYITIDNKTYTLSGYEIR